MMARALADSAFKMLIQCQLATSADAVGTVHVTNSPQTARNTLNDM